jgi:membrane associated rhomboid family serine protease
LVIRHVEEPTVRKSNFSELFPVTSFLLLFVVAFYCLELIAYWKLTGEFPLFRHQAGPQIRVTWLLGSLSWADMREGEYWRVIACTFLHGGLLHIVFNGLVLWDMGRICEPFLSSWKFLVAYGVSALGGSVGSLVHKVYLVGSPQGDFISTVGASGALSGLIGLLLVYSVRARDVDLRDALLRWIVYIALLSYFFRGIDHAAHLGGFLAGAAMGWTVESYISSRAAARWRIPGYVTAAVILACLTLAVLHYLENRG